MANKITYDNYNRAELVELINRKNKQVDSQRAMLNHLRKRRDKLQAKVTEGRQIAKENKSLKAEIERLNQWIAKVLPKPRKDEWVKGIMPNLIAMLLGYYKLKKNANMPVTTMLILILGYQSTHFLLSDIELLFQKWERNPDWLWRDKFRRLCDKGVFYSFKNGRKKHYYMSIIARDNFEYLFKYVTECSDGLYPVKVRQTAGTLGLEKYFFN